MIKESVTGMNPVGIIALFAALSEASAATALPFLNEENQQVYVWFLITFPSTLTLMFFLTLNFNYKALYAPSDFSNEKNFLKFFKQADFPLTDGAHGKAETTVIGDTEKKAIKNNILVPIRPVTPHRHHSILTLSSLSRVSPPYKTHKSFSRLLLHSASRVDVVYGGPISCGRDLEQVLSQLSVDPGSAINASPLTTRLILLLKAHSDSLSDEEIVTTINRFIKCARHPDAFAIMTPDSNEVFIF